MAKGRAKTSEKLKPVITLVGTEDWLEWLKRYAEFRGFQMTTAIDVALRDQARRDGFEEPMPKRFTR
jgi:hypothetical protein